MRGVLPESVRTRRDKYGFPVPEVNWIYDRFRPAIEDMFASPSFRERGIFDVGRLQQQYAEEARMYNNGVSLWGRRSRWFRAISLETWHRNLSRYNTTRNQHSPHSPCNIVNPTTTSATSGTLH